MGKNQKATTADPEITYDAILGADAPLRCDPNGPKAGRLHAIDYLITERFFSLVRAGQRVLFHCDCRCAGILDLVRLEGVELDVLGVFRGNIRVGVDRVHGANLHTCHAINAVVGMNHHLVFHFVEARDGADFYAVGEFTSITFLGDNVGHGILMIKIF